MNDDLNLGKTLGVIAGVGIIAGIGRLLTSKEVLTWRLVFGRVFVSAALSVGAASALAFLPNISTLALIGLSSACAVLGEQFLEKVLSAKAGVQG